MTAAAPLVLYGIGALIAMIAAAKAQDTLFAVHMWIFVVAALIAAIFKVRSFKFDDETAPPSEEKYLDGVVRAGAVITLFWGVVGFLVGVVIAAQLAWPELNLGPSWLNFGRLRPLHTSAVIFAFGGNALKPRYEQLVEGCWTVCRPGVQAAVHASQGYIYTDLRGQGHVFECLLALTVQLIGYKVRGNLNRHQPSRFPHGNAQGAHCGGQCQVVTDQLFEAFEGVETLRVTVRAGPGTFERF